MPSPLLHALLPTALAAGLHTGVVLEGHEGFEAPRHQSAREGVSLDFKGGIARIYVGPSELAAQEWFAEKGAFVARQKPSPLDGFGDEALHAGDAMVLVRDGNVGLLVQVKAGARAAAETLLQAVDDSGAPPPPPGRLVPEGDALRLDAPDAAHVAWTGGRLLPQGPGLRFGAPPALVVTWGPLGRATTQAYDADGVPVDTPPPRPDPAFLPPPTDPPAAP
jgi:hypothetical protein